MKTKEKVNQQKWEVLQEIEEELQATSKGKPIKYNLLAKGSVPLERKDKLIGRLETEGAFTIRRRADGVRIGSKDIYQLIISPPRFYEVLKKYRPEQDKKWVDIDKFFPKDISLKDFSANGKIEKVINYIENEKEAILYDGKKPENTFIVFAPVSGGLGSDLGDYDVVKFLVYLKRKGITKDVHLPIFFKETENKEVVDVRSEAWVWMEASYAMKEAIRSPEEFRNKIPRLKITDWKKFEAIKKEVIKSKKPAKQTNEKLRVDKPAQALTITVKDRQIWINDWLISKPHAVGSNFEFFEHIRSQKPRTKVTREGLPETLKNQIQHKGFIKILNGLGFKGEITKAFFYERGKDTLTYRGNQISKKDLEEAGVKHSLLIKELDLAHTRNSPE